MKNLSILIASLGIYFISTTAFAQSNKADRLRGDMDLTIDVSEMKDTVGKFMLMVGGELLYPKIQNNLLVVKHVMKEPRRAFLAFYPDEKVEANPGKALNEIAAGYSDNYTFLSTPGNIKLKVKGSLANTELAIPSEAQSKYISLLKLKESFENQFTNENRTLITEMNNAKDKNSKDSMVSIYLKRYRILYQDKILEFIRSNPDSPASLIELEEFSYKPDKDLKLFTFLYNNLTDRMKALPTAKRIYNTVDAENFVVNSLLGKPAPNFTQNDTAGRAVSLSDFKGKVTLLEFWASWCGPCRESNPALVKTYQKFNGKGFKILGVSLDDNKENWLKAIKADELSWTQVSDLKFWKNSAAILYHVSGIPSNVLIDKDGKVIANNLTEKQLDEQLSKLLLK